MNNEIFEFDDDFEDDYQLYCKEQLLNGFWEIEEVIS